MKASITGSLAGAGLIVIGRCTPIKPAGQTEVDRIFRAIAIAATGLNE
jgi:hypothetical protein